MDQIRNLSKDSPIKHVNIRLKMLNWLIKEMLEQKWRKPYKGER